MPPCTTIRRITTNFKTKNTQNCQKIKLHGSLTTKYVKKPSSPQASSSGRDGEPGWRGWGKVLTGGLGEVAAPDGAAPHSHADKLGETTGE